MTLHVLRRPPAKPLSWSLPGQAHCGRGERHFFLLPSLTSLPAPTALLVSRRDQQVQAGWPRPPESEGLQTGFSIAIK